MLKDQVEKKEIKLNAIVNTHQYVNFPFGGSLRSESRHAHGFYTVTGTMLAVTRRS